MQNLPPGLQDKDEITREDLLRAMEKLSMIIENEKPVENNDPNYQYYESPQKPYQQVSSPTKSAHHRMDGEIDYLNEPELIENVKAAARDLSELVKQTDEVDRSYRKSVISNGQGGYGDPNASRLDRSQIQDTVNRLYELDGKKREKIASLQFQKYKEELQSVKARPEISLTSKILAESKQREPIYQRTDNIIKKREENLGKLRREIEESKYERDPAPTFQPNLISKKPMYGNERVRSAKEFTDELYAWQSKKIETLQKEQYEVLTKEVEELTFKPKINKKSLQLAHKRANENVRVEDRLSKLQDEKRDKIREIREKEKPLFKPQLNEKSERLSRNRKNNIQSVWKHGKGQRDLSHNNISFVETQPYTIGGSGDDSYIEPQRSYTPMRGGTRKSHVNNKTPRVHEVEYTPAMDFLLRKVA